jgi:threonine/homoserine/homoserine lactone efflux protein
MTLSTYLLYLAAVAVLVLSPGPTMLMCITRALQHGWARGIVSGLGSVTAALGIMLLSALGLGAVLAASETAFMALKVGGAAYLIYLGVKTWRSPAVAFTPEAAGSAVLPSLRACYAQGLMVGASNPKALLFFAAFFPQFLNPAAAWGPQMAVLAATFTAMEMSVLTLCALGTARIAPFLGSSAHVRWINRVCGGLFTAMGGVLLTVRRHA